MPKITFMPLSDQYKKIGPEPIPISKEVPDWYKHQPPIMDNMDAPVNGSYPLTVKKCQAIFDAMTSGYLIKVPCDIYIDTTNGKEEFQVPQKLNFIEHVLLSRHPQQQVSHLPIDKDIYIPSMLRIHPLWLAKTEPGYSCLFTDPMHSEVSPIRAVPGIIDTDNFYSDGHLSFYLKKDFKGIIKRGTPMIQVFPFRREEWQHEIIKCNDPELDVQRALVRATFKNGYRTNFWQKKTYQ